MNLTITKHVCIFMLTASCCALSAFAQTGGLSVAQTAGPVAGPGPVTTIGVAGAFARGSAAAPVVGAPYSATVTNESVQTLADGNRIVQSSSGTIARDSQGRTRQDTMLPPIGNLSAANAPHLIFIHDPVAQTSYTLNLTDKTAQKMPVPPLPPLPLPLLNGKGDGLDVAIADVAIASGAEVSRGARGPAGAGPDALYIQTNDMAAASGQLPPPPMIAQKVFLTNDQGQATTEDLGSQTMEGVFVTGVRTTRTIAAGQIGNDKPISIVTEVWTSPDLKTIVYSKRSDPRMGEQTFQLTNITRAEPDASLFTVPADFKLVEGPKPIIYRSNQ
jgi:hypothetical protein